MTQVPGKAPLPFDLIPPLALLQIVDQPVTPREVVAVAARVLLGLAIAYAAYLFIRRNPWPRPFRFRFLLVHVAAWFVASTTWLLLTTAAIVIITGRPFVPTITQVPLDFYNIGITIYGVIAAVTYLDDAATRAARAEAAAAQTHLAALRAQLQPHFMFNALHTVVQLIRIDPPRAADAAEALAGLLRTALDEQREVVSLADEWAFVSRYLELEKIRFGDRLRVVATIDPACCDAQVPAFALQTLVENAVQHGAAPRVEPTDIIIAASCTFDGLLLSVSNTGDASTAQLPARSAGTGLKRLRERLSMLHGESAMLACAPRPNGGFDARLVLPRERSPE